VGTVWFGFMVDGRLFSETKRFDGDRAAVRRQTVDHALTRLVEHLQEWQP
jgi:nicotinamide-nucleotide amidase